MVVLPHSGDQAPRELGGASADPSLTEGAYRALRALAARKLRGALAARMLRQILVDHARKRGALERGGGGRSEGVDSLGVSSGGLDTDVLDLEIALEELAARDPRRARVVELRFFGGLSAAKAARELGVSEDTVKRDWHLARAWLDRELGRKRGPGVTPADRSDEIARLFEAACELPAAGDAAVARGAGRALLVRGRRRRR